LTYLCTPTDTHLIPKDVWAASAQYYKDYSGRFFCKFIYLYKFISQFSL